MAANPNNSIRETIAAGANAIAYTPLSTQELFQQIRSFQIHPRELGITLMHEHLAELNNSMKRCYADWFHADIFLEKIKPVFQKAKNTD